MAGWQGGLLLLLAASSLLFSAAPAAADFQFHIPGLLHPPTKPNTQGLQLPPNVTRSINCGETGTLALQKLITVDSSDVCRGFGLDKPSGFKCTALNFIDRWTQQVSSDCTPHSQVPVKSTALDGTPIPQPLQDRRPLPPGSWSAADEAALMKEEGPTQYWHITNVINLFLWAPCHPVGATNATDWRVPEGWTLIKMLDVATGDPRTEEGKSKPRLPAIGIIRNADGRQLAIIVRGTRTALEWQVDLTYQQESNPHYPGLVSTGFAEAADYLWPGVEEALREEVVKGGIKHVTVSGHSLGAAVSGLLAYRAQDLLDKELKAAKKEPITVGALLFAMPNTGNNAFVAAFNQKGACVNARRIAYVNDIIPQVPCAPNMMACSNPDNPQYSPNVTSWNYGRVGGQIRISPEGMPVQQEAWSRLSTINACKLSPWAIATHVCSYPCYFSQFVDAAANGRCKLWADDASVPDGDGMTNPEYCPRYPQRNPTFPVPLVPPSKVVLGRRRHY